jgi:uncharacterized protein (DUF952 family)/lysophospholipase L1-like esterase
MTSPGGGPVPGAGDDIAVFERYVALGDSQTEGLIDPDGRGGYRGWADRLAETLAAGSPHLQYANLAVRGRLMGQIRAEQLGPALAQRPDVVTVMGGLNDVLRPAFDLDAVVGDLEAMLGALRDTGATVLTNTFPDIAAIAPVLRRLGPRVDAFNAAIRAAARRHDARVVDFAGRGVGTDLRIWSADRIHANALGHALIAAAFADALAVPGYADWSEPLPDAVRQQRRHRLGGEARWLGRTVVPWLLRRARGRSSGDGITAKRPRLVPVASLFHLVAPGDWPATGWYAPPSLAAEGFVHLSFADQVAGSANRHYGDAAELAAVELDPAALPARIAVEDSYGGGTAFPHVYGPVPAGAAVAVHPLDRGPDGAWAFNPVPAGVAASPGR